MISPLKRESYSKALEQCFRAKTSWGPSMGDEDIPAMIIRDNKPFDYGTIQTLVPF